MLFKQNTVLFLKCPMSIATCKMYLTLWSGKWGEAYMKRTRVIPRVIPFRGKRCSVGTSLGVLSLKRSIAVKFLQYLLIEC